MRAALRKLLSYQISIGALIEIALIATIPYIIAGMALASTQSSRVSQLQTQTGSDPLLGFLLTAATWPALLLTTDTCGS